jgi:VIT1/CCC1 family predicted Fe2+/Mn2+ transporter
VLHDATLALRVAKGVAVAMLFLLGWWIGRWSGASPGRSGLVLALAGAVLSVACIALGG